MCSCMWRPEVHTGCLPPSSPYLSLCAIAHTWRSKDNLSCWYLLPLCLTGSFVVQGSSVSWLQFHLKNRISHTILCQLYVTSEDSNSGPQTCMLTPYPLTHISNPQPPHFLSQGLPLTLGLTDSTRSKHFTRLSPQEKAISPGDGTVSSKSALRNFHSRRMT